MENNQEITAETRVISLHSGHSQASLNPKREPITVSKLRSFEGLENLTNEEAERMVSSIHHLCNLIYDYLAQQSPVESNNHPPYRKAA